MAAEPRTDPAAAHLLLLFCVIVWGATFVATKVCLPYLHPVEVVGLRFGIGLPILFALVRLRRVDLSFERSDLAALACGSALLAAHFPLQAVALTYTSASNTSWIIAVAPLAIALAAALFLGERAGRRLWAGIAAATLGVVVLVSRGRPASLGWVESKGEWMVLVTAGTWALYTVLTRDLSRRKSPLAVALLVHTPLLLLCLGTMALHSSPSRLLALPRAAVLSILFLGVLGTLAQWFWQEGLARVGAARAAIYLYLEPLATLALAVPLLHEPVGWFTVAGGALILGGVAWAERAG